MQKTLHICHYTSVHQAFDIRIFHKECVSLVKAGYRVTLVATGVENQVVDGVQIIGVPKAKGRLERMFSLARKVTKTALAQNADYYHFHDPELLPHVGLLLRKEKKVVYDAHEDLPKQLAAKPYLKAWQKPLVAFAAHRLLHWFVPQLSGVVAATESIQNYYQPLNKNVVVARNYPLLSEGTAFTGTARKEPAICYVGGISEARGIFDLLDAMLLQNGFYLNLAGSFHSAAEEARAKAHPAWERVHFHGQLGRKDLATVLAVSKIGICVLHPLPNHIESLPIKLFEYMQAGLPVIASDFPLWQQIVTDNQVGVCIPANQPQQLAKAIADLLSNESQLFSFGANGKKAIVERLNWEHEFEEMKKIYG